MNFPGVVYGDPTMSGEIEATLRAGKTVTGHFPAEDDRMLQAYLATGVSSDHETVTRAGFGKGSPRYASDDPRRFGLAGCEGSD